jgi:hypothetical protein
MPDQRDPTDREAEGIAHALGEDQPAGAEDGETYPDTVEAQDEFEALLRQYGGDFQKAVDAQRRGERPRKEEPGSQNW